MKDKAKLPFSSEFSPSQIGLPKLLELVFKHESNTRVLEDAIKKLFFASHGGGIDENRRKLAMNCRLGMKAYGILDKDSNLTSFGKKLHDLRDEDQLLYETFSRHILLTCNGMSLVQCIRDMNAAGEEVNLTTLREGLAKRGISYPRGGKHASIMKLWLAKAGIFTGARWQINETRLQAVLGTGQDDFGILSALTHEQRSFLKALANTGIETPQPSNEIAKLAAANYGVKFPEKSLPKSVLHALEREGYITLSKTTGGRGAKPLMVAPTPKLVHDVVDPLIDQLKDQVDVKLLGLLRKSLTEIIAEIDSKDTFVKGLALEALAVKLMMLLDMTYVTTRLRAQATGGAEVDLIFESERLVFSRWQVQCKNTDCVTLDDVCKEVGLTHLLKSNVIVVVSTGKIGLQARRYANKVMTDSNLCIVLIDRSDLLEIRQSPPHILVAFNRDARATKALKKLTLS